MRAAVIGIGSNSVRMLVAEAADGEIRPQGDGLAIVFSAVFFGLLPESSLPGVLPPSLLRTFTT